MPPPWQDIEHIQLRHKILLLQLLNNTPEKPSVARISEQRGYDHVHELSLQREKELTESFAFLAATTNDPKKVVAACIEERATGLTIRLAVNHGGLETVKAGFERMATVLERVARADNAHTIEQDQLTLLHEAVQLNQNRILIRLRSRHAVLKCNYKKEKSQKPKIIPQLHSAVMEATSAKGSITMALRADIKRLNKLFSRLESLSTSHAQSTKGLSIVMDIVTICHQIQTQTLQQVLSRSAVLPPESKELFPMVVTKLGRYFSVCKFLLHTAQRYRPLFSGIRIGVVAFKRPGLSEEDVELDPTTETAIDQLLQQGLPPKTLKPVYFGQSSSELLKDHICREATVAVPVHAEIQLLFHFQQVGNATGDVPIPPRIICSSKKACFLCNLFFRLHGRFIVPSTHGRLYEKWSLPEIPRDGGRHESILSTVRRFVTALDGAISREVQSPRKPYPQPHESMVLFSAAASEANQLPVPGTERIITPAVQDQSGDRQIIPPTIADTEPQRDSHIPSAETQVQLPTPTLPSPAEHPKPIPPSSPASTSSSTTTIVPPHIYTSPYITLKRGQPIHQQLSSQQQSSVLRKTSSDEGRPEDDENDNPSYWVIVEYLPLPPPSPPPSTAHNERRNNTSNRAINTDMNADIDHPHDKQPQSQPHAVEPVVNIDNDNFQKMTLDYGLEADFPRKLRVSRKTDVVAIAYYRDQPVLPI